MAQKKNITTANIEKMQEMLNQERSRATKAMQEINGKDGVFSKETNEWLLEMGMLGEEEARMLYFGQAIRGLMPGCDWGLMEQWAKDIEKANPDMGNYMLGCLYLEDTPGPVDNEKAKRYFRQGAAVGCEECKRMLEEIEFYEEKEKLLAELSELLDATEEGTDAEMYKRLHYHCLQQGNFKEARRQLKLWLKEEPHNEEALTQMAACYANGLGVTKSYKQAYKYYQLAADGGSVEGLFYVGLMHYCGNGCTQNYEKAFECFTQAAKQKYGRAYYYLGVCSEWGQGTAQDGIQALKYYKTGAAKNDPECHVAMAHAYMNGIGVPEDYKKAEQHLKKARKALPPNAESIEEKIQLAERMLIFSRTLG